MLLQVVTPQSVQQEEQAAEADSARQAGHPHRQGHAAGLERGLPAMASPALEPMVS